MDEEAAEAESWTIDGLTVTDHGVAQDLTAATEEQVAMVQGIIAADETVGVATALQTAIEATE